MNRTILFSSCTVFLVFANGPAAHAAAPPAVADGMQAFNQHRWLDAMAAFLEVLRSDPENADAHKYIPLTIHEIEAHNGAVVQDVRLNMLTDTSERLKFERMDARPVDQALATVSHKDTDRQELRWERWLEEAKVARQLGHLLNANELVLHIIAEKHDHREAQQELSILQSDLHHALDTSTDLLVDERYAYEGFYAYGQQDMAAAAKAWEKARTLIQQAYPAPQVTERLAALRFEEFEKIADADVEEKARQAKLTALFDQGIALYQARQFTKALETFRDVALSNPEYPQLAYYLVHAESGAEEERTRLFSEARRREVRAALEKGVRHMEHEEYKEAEASFRIALNIDPSNPDAKSYLAAVVAEIQRRQDPKAAQAHYETGLIDYASGKLEEAAREWRIASHMDPQNEKAVNALAKVQKELTFAKELP